MTHAPASTPGSTPESTPGSSPAPAVVATDLDGTVVRSDGTISERTRAALGLAHAAGAYIVIATGRPPRWLVGISAAAGYADLAICANGALVYDLVAEKVIDSRPLPAEIAREVIVRLRGAIPGIGFAVERVDGLFAHEPDYHVRWDPEPTTVVGDLGPVLNAPISKLLARDEGVDSDGLLALGLSAIGDLPASLTHSSIDGLLEISALGVTKASTLEEVLAPRGLAASDVVAFGDMLNDLDLLTWAGHGVAVANAHPDVLSVVDEVTASNDDDGVAQVLERLYA
jgi:hydroxymethylpyrimidine pyrophosphatase-like HAD family hydrolase